MQEIKPNLACLSLRCQVLFVLLLCIQIRGQITPRDVKFLAQELESRLSDVRMKQMREDINGNKINPLITTTRPTPWELNKVEWYERKLTEKGWSHERVQDWKNTKQNLVDHFDALSAVNRAEALKKLRLMISESTLLTQSFGVKVDVISRKISISATSNALDYGSWNGKGRPAIVQQDWNNAESFAIMTELKKPFFRGKYEGFEVERVQAVSTFNVKNSGASDDGRIVTLTDFDEHGHIREIRHKIPARGKFRHPAGHANLINPAYHAETVLLKHQSLNRKNIKYSDSGGDVIIEASKNPCIYCDKIPRTLMDSQLGVANWIYPDQIEIFPIGTVDEPTHMKDSPTPRFFEHEKVDPVQALQEACKCDWCMYRGRRKRRSVCSLEDVQDLDADVIGQNLKDMPEHKQKVVIAALDEVGMRKLRGTQAGIHSIKKTIRHWKSSITKGISTMLNGGTLMKNLFQGKYIQGLQKSAISPKSIASSSAHGPSSELARHKKLFAAEEAGSAKVVKWVNIAMIGRGFIPGIVDGDPESIAKMTGLLVGGYAVDRFGQGIAHRGVNHGSKVIGKLLKVVGPIVGSAPLAFSAYNLASQVNELRETRAQCEENDEDMLFQEKFRRNCAVDQNVAIAQVVGESVNLGLGLASAATTILSLLSVSTGPAGVIFAVTDVAIAVGTQIYSAVLEVDRVTSMIKGGLNGSETFKSGIGFFFGLGPPASVQKLLEQKELMTKDVQSAYDFLLSHREIQTYVIPLTYTSKVNCTYSYKDGWKWATRIVSFGISSLKDHTVAEEDKGTIFVEEECDTKRDYISDSDVDFSAARQVHGLRVEPHTPNENLARLECVPNKPYGASRGPHDSEFYGAPYETFLCHSVVAVTALNREEFPVMIDLKNGRDTAKGFVNKTNIFRINSGEKNFTGGVKDDSYVLLGYPMRGYFDGGGGTNSLYIDNSLRNEKINIDLDAESEFYFIRNIQQVFGRVKKSDSVTTACDTKFVDLKGGTASHLDEIYVPELIECKAITVLHLSGCTSVANRHQGGQFFYHVNLTGPIYVDVTLENTSHHFNFVDQQSSAYIFILNDNTLTVKNYKNVHKSTLEVNYEVSRNLTFKIASGVYVLYDQDAGFFGYGSTHNDNNSAVLKGLENYINTFDVIAVEKKVHYVGGNRSDVFEFKGNEVPNAKVSGYKGSDSIVLPDDFAAGQRITVDFVNENLFSSKSVTEITSIEELRGRQGEQEIVVVSCSQSRIDSGGGSEKNQDIVEIPSSQNCARSTVTIIANNFTQITNLALSGDFRYEIMGNMSTINVTTVRQRRDVSHYFTLSKNSSQLRMVKLNYQTGELLLPFSSNTSFKAIIPPEKTVIALADGLNVYFVPSVHGQINTKDSKGTTSLRHYPNKFWLQEASEESVWIGGNDDDSFLLMSEKFEGYFDGYDGNNSLVLSDEFLPEEPVLVNMAGLISFNGSGYNNEREIYFTSIQSFMGRSSGVEAVLANCGTQLIDTRGCLGGSSHDYIVIPMDYSCSYSIHLALYSNLEIVNLATSGSFTYHGEVFENGNCTLYLSLTEDTQHEITFGFTFPSLKKIWTENDRLFVEVNDKSTFSVNFDIRDDHDFQTRPTIKFHDGLQLKIAKFSGFSNSVYGIFDLSSRNSSKEKRSVGGFDLEAYCEAAKRTQTDVTVQLKDGSLYTIGAGAKTDILTAVPGFDNVLVLNGAENTILRIASGAGHVVVMRNPMMPNEEEFGSINSLSSILVDLKAFSSSESTLKDVQINAEGDDLVFEVESSTVVLPNYAGQESSINVLLRDTFLEVQCNDECELVPKHLIIEPEKTSLVILDPDDLEVGKKVLIRNSTATAYEILRRNDDLVLTNVFSTEDEEDDLLEVSTLMISNYFISTTAQDLRDRNVTFGFESESAELELPLSTKEIRGYDERHQQVFGKNYLIYWICVVPMTAFIAVVVIYLTVRRSNPMDDLEKTDDPIPEPEMEHLTTNPVEPTTKNGDHHSHIPQTTESEPMAQKTHKFKAKIYRIPVYNNKRPPMYW